MCGCDIDELYKAGIIYVGVGIEWDQLLIVTGKLALNGNKENPPIYLFPTKENSF